MEVLVDARDERGEIDGTETPTRILASALAEGHEVEVVEFVDGTLAIRFDGAVPAPYHWGASQLDSCMNLYLRLLRR